jgi:hypothetical protein
MARLRVFSDSQKLDFAFHSHILMQIEMKRGCGIAEKEGFWSFEGGFISAFPIQLSRDLILSLTCMSKFLASSSVFLSTSPVTGSVSRLYH